MKKGLLMLTTLFIVVGCGGTRNVSNSSGSVEDIATAKLIGNYYDNSFDFNTLAARMRVKYRDKKNGQTVTVSLRMEKDKTIWMSASLLGISLAKAKVTPDRVAYYEKVGRTYFDGDFSFLSEYFGVDMNFEQLQRLLLGQAVYDLRDGRYNVAQENNQYLITPKRQLDLLSLFFYLEPDNFILKKQRVTQPKDNLFLNVDYKSHQQIASKPFPENIFIEVLENQDRTTIEIDYKSVDVNAAVRFPFSIPSGYKEIQFDGQ